MKRAIDLKLDWQIHYSDQIPRTAIFVTKDAHIAYMIFCLAMNQESSKLEIPLIIGNHDSLEDVAQRFGIPSSSYLRLPKKTKLNRKKRKLLYSKNTILIQLFSQDICKSRVIVLFH